MAGEKKRRRNRGEGSIEETADGRFRIRYSYVDSRGERHKPSKTCDTRKQCYTWYAEQVGKSHGTYDTFDQWFTAWLEIQRAKRAHATWDRDRQVVESHLRPEWGRSKVKALTLTAFERWFGRLQAAGVSDSERDRCATTMRKIVRAAVAHRIIPESPLTGLKLPTVDRESKRYGRVKQTICIFRLCGIECWKRHK